MNRHVSLSDIAFVERASHGSLKLALTVGCTIVLVMAVASFRLGFLLHMGLYSYQDTFTVIKVIVASFISLIELAGGLVAAGIVRHRVAGGRQMHG